MSESIYYGQLRFYRAPKDPTKGSAFAVNFRQDVDNYNKGLLFFTMAQQTGVDENGNGSYAWEDKSRSVIFKLGEADIAEVLAVLTGQKESLGLKGTLFHQTPKGGSSTLTLTRNKDDGSYFIKLTYQDVQKNVVNVSMKLSIGEAELLRLYVTNAVVKSWGF